MNRSIMIGFDQREANAFAVACHSLTYHLTQRIPLYGLVLDDLKERGLYKRPMEWRKSPYSAESPAQPLIMWDVISDHPMSTEHANARFFAPLLAKTGWVLFTDGDFLFRHNVARLFEDLDPKYALYCVKHDHRPDTKIKMDGQVQSKYARKNWSSCMVFNCDHPANDALTLEMLNTLPGRELHRMCWIEDDDLIGSLDPAWNWLVGYSSPEIEPKAVHFTEGVPDMVGYENVPYADEWRSMLHAWARRIA